MVVPERPWESTVKRCPRATCRSRVEKERLASDALTTAGWREGLVSAKSADVVDFTIWGGADAVPGLPEFLIDRNRFASRRLCLSGRLRLRSPLRRGKGWPPGQLTLSPCLRRSMEGPGPSGPARPPATPARSDGLIHALSASSTRPLAIGYFFRSRFCVRSPRSPCPLCRPRKPAGACTP